MRYKNNCLLLKRELLSRWGMEKTVEMNKKQEQLYEEYRLIQYDIVSGKQYSLENQFLAKRAWDKNHFGFLSQAQN